MNYSVCKMISESDSNLVYFYLDDFCEEIHVEVEEQIMWMYTPSLAWCCGWVYWQITVLFYHVHVTLLCTQSLYVGRHSFPPFIYSWFYLHNQLGTCIMSSSAHSVFSFSELLYDSLMFTVRLSLHLLHPSLPVQLKLGLALLQALLLLQPSTHLLLESTKPHTTIH